MHVGAPNEVRKLGLIPYRHERQKIPHFVGASQPIN
jgi:hypothetical protein